MKNKGALKEGGINTDKIKCDVTNDDDHDRFVYVDVTFQHGDGNDPINSHEYEDDPVYSRDHEGHTVHSHESEHDLVHRHDCHDSVDDSESSHESEVYEENNSSQGDDHENSHDSEDPNNSHDLEKTGIEEIHIDEDVEDRSVVEDGPDEESHTAETGRGTKDLSLDTPSELMGEEELGTQNMGDIIHTNNDVIETNEKPEEHLEPTIGETGNIVKEANIEEIELCRGAKGGIIEQKEREIPVPKPRRGERKKKPPDRYGDYVYSLQPTIPIDNKLRSFDTLMRSVILNDMDSETARNIVEAVMSTKFK